MAFGSWIIFGIFHSPRETPPPHHVEACRYVTVGGIRKCRTSREVAGEANREVAGAGLRSEACLGGRDVARGAPFLKHQRLSAEP